MPFDQGVPHYTMKMGLFYLCQVLCDNITCSLQMPLGLPFSKELRLSQTVCLSAFLPLFPPRIQGIGTGHKFSEEKQLCRGEALLCLAGFHQDLAASQRWGTHTGLSPRKLSELLGL